MVKFLFSLFVLIIFAVIDGKDVFDSKDVKKIITYTLVFLFGTVLNLLIIMEVKMPNPLEPIKNFIVSVFDKD